MGEEAEKKEHLIDVPDDLVASKLASGSENRNLISCTNTLPKMERKKESEHEANEITCSNEPEKNGSPVLPGSRIVLLSLSPDNECVSGRERKRVSHKKKGRTNDQ